MTPLSSQKATARACGCVRSPRPFVVRSWQHACTRHDLLQCRENGSRFRRLEHASTFQYPAVSALIRCVRWCDGAVKQLRAMTLQHRMRLWVSTCCQSSYCFVLPLSCLCSFFFLFFSLFLSFSNILFTLACLLNTFNRQDHGLAVVDGVLYALGGHGATRNGAISTVEEYNAAEQTWGVVARDMPTRDSMGCTTCRGIIVVVGGYLWNQGGSNAIRSGDANSGGGSGGGGGGGVSNDSSGVRSSSSSSSSPSSLLLPSLASAAVAVKVPTVSVEGFCPATKHWTTYPNLPTPRFGLSCVEVDGTYSIIVYRVCYFSHFITMSIHCVVVFFLDCYSFFLFPSFVLLFLSLFASFEGRFACVRAC